MCCIQCGLARRSFSAVAGLSASMTSATFMKKRRMTLHRRAAVMATASCGSRLPISGVRGAHRARVIGRPRCIRYRSSAARASGSRTALLPVRPVIVVRVDLDLPQGGIHQLADAQARGVGEIEHKAKALRSGRFPAMHPCHRPPPTQIRTGLNPPSFTVSMIPFSQELCSRKIPGDSHSVGFLVAFDERAIKVRECAGRPARSKG